MKKEKARSVWLLRGRLGGVWDMVCGYALNKEWKGTQRRKNEFDLWSLSTRAGSWPSAENSAQVHHSSSGHSSDAWAEKVWDLCCALGSLVQCSWLHNNLYFILSKPSGGEKVILPHMTIMLSETVWFLKRKDRWKDRFLSVRRQRISSLKLNTLSRVADLQVVWQE